VETAYIGNRNKEGKRLNLRCKIKALLLNNFGRRQATSVAFSECVSVAQLFSMQSACFILYYHLWSVRLYYIFPTLCHKWCDFRGGEKKGSEYINGALIFSTNLSKTFLILRRIQRDIVIVVKTRYTCRVLTKLEFPRQIFGKTSDIKFNGNPFSRSRVFFFFSWGRADGHDRVNSRVSEFCEGK
jgi:hypothetical protein